jgi:hypothetical protein
MLIKIKVKPSAKKEQILKKSPDSFEISVREKPIEGLANERVREILAGFLGVPQSRIRLKKGGRKRNKIFEILEK